MVTADQEFTVSANIDGGMPWRRTFGDNVVYTDWQRDNYVAVIADRLKDAGLASGRIGVEDDVLPLQQRQKFAAALPAF